MAYTSEIEKLERRHRENPNGRTFAILADHYRKAGEFDRANALLKEGLEVHPDYPSALIVLGRCHLDMGQDAEAEVPFRRVLELDHENGIALRAMADIAERHGRHPEARRWLETLLAIDSGNEGAREQLNRVSEAIIPPSVEMDPILAEPPVQEEAGEPEVPSLEEAGEPEVPSLLEDDHETWLPEAGFVEHESEALPDPEATGKADESFDIGVVRAEEIVLRPSESTEYQTPNDADSLLHEADDGDMVDTSPGDDQALADEPEMGYFEEDAAHPYSPQNWDVPAGSEPAAEPDRLTGWEGSFPGGGDSENEAPPVSGEIADPMEEPDSDPAGDVPPVIEPVPGWWSEEEVRVLEPPMAAEYVEHGPGSEAEEVEEEPGGASDAIPPGAGLPSDEDVEVEEGAEEPDGEWGAGSGELEADAPVGAFGVTETLAEIYLAQGHHREAAQVYRQLLARSPGNARLQEKLTAAEARASRAVSREDHPSYSAGESGGQSVEGYFTELLAARPAQANSGPDAAPEEADAGPTRPPASAAPTRPATDALSLSAIFGEDGPEGQADPLPDSSPGAPPAAPGMSFDEFFGPGGDRSQARPSRGSREGDEDLTQFHDWLKSLKS